jgi:hypothetical protein
MDEESEGWQQLTVLLDALPRNVDEDGWGDACLQVLADLVGATGASLTAAGGGVLATTDRPPPERGVEGEVRQLPIQLKGVDAPVLSLTFGGSTPELSEADLAVGRLVATLVAMTARLERESATAQQLQSALDSRVVIEQAKGVLATAAGVDVETAFELIRSHARRTSTPLRTVARAVVQDGYRPTYAASPEQPHQAPKAFPGR